MDHRQTCLPKARDRQALHGQDGLEINALTPISRSYYFTELLGLDPTFNHRPCCISLFSAEEGGGMTISSYQSKPQFALRQGHPTIRVSTSAYCETPLYSFLLTPQNLCWRALSRARCFPLFLCYSVFIGETAQITRCLLLPLSCPSFHPAYPDPPFHLRSSADSFFPPPATAP